MANQWTLMILNAKSINNSVHPWKIKNMNCLQWRTYEIIDLHCRIIRTQQIQWTVNTSQVARLTANTNRKTNALSISINGFRWNLDQDKSCIFIDKYINPMTSLQQHNSMASIVTNKRDGFPPTYEYTQWFLNAQSIHFNSNEKHHLFFSKIN